MYIYISVPQLALCNNLYSTNELYVWYKIDTIKHKQDAYKYSSIT